MNVVRNVFKTPRVLPGAGATEMAVARFLRQKAQTVQGQMAFPYKAVADALEVIPRTICQNCGADTIRVMTQLRALHTKEENISKGIDGEKGIIVNVNDLDLWEPFVVKESAIKTSMEAACMLLRIDDIVSGVTSAELENFLAGK
jgi:T-complex protein 1 subunit gamma